MPNFGVIYIVHNPKDGEHVYKVGKTERDVPSRIVELNADTTNLGRYSACAFFVVADVNAAEQACHNRLKQYRLQENREFFELELGRLLPLVQEAVQPFLAQNFVPEIPCAESTSKAHSKLPLAQRLKRQREHSAIVADARRLQEEQSSTDLLATINRWAEELQAKILVVQEAFADLDFIRWEKDCWNLRQSEKKWIGLAPEASRSIVQEEARKGYISLNELAERIQARDDYKSIDSRYRDQALRDLISSMHSSGKLPSAAARSEGATWERRILRLIAHVIFCSSWRSKTELDERVEPFPLDEKEGGEKLDDARVVGELLMLVRGQEIQIAAFSVKGQTDSIQGAASCSSPDEAIDLLGALVSEYAANPIPAGETASMYKTALLGGSAGDPGVSL